MQLGKAQLTTRGILWATFWMSFCFLTWRLARSRVFSAGEFFVISVCLAVMAISVLLRNAAIARQSDRMLAIVLGIAIWQVIATSMTCIYWRTVAYTVLAAYQACFEENAVNDSRYLLVARLAWIASTMPVAAFVSLWAATKFSRRAWFWKRSLVAALAWVVLDYALLFSAQELSAWIRSSRWQLSIPAVFFPPFDIILQGSPLATVRFWDPIVAETTAWVVLTTPAAFLVLWFYARPWRALAAEVPPATPSENKDRETTLGPFRNEST